MGRGGGGGFKGGCIIRIVGKGNGSGISSEFVTSVFYCDYNLLGVSSCGLEIVKPMRCITSHPLCSQFTCSMPVWLHAIRSPRPAWRRGKA